MNQWNIQGAKAIARTIVLSCVLCAIFLIFMAGALSKPETTRSEIVYVEQIIRDEPIVYYTDTFYAREQKLEAKVEYTYTKVEVELIARTLWGECRGIPSTQEKAAVVWCILNRVDSPRYGDTIKSVVTAPWQFVGYRSSNPLSEELVELAEDVLRRWCREKAGIVDVGRTLPNDYFFFTGDGYRNNFRKNYESTTYWDWSLSNPYDD